MEFRITNAVLNNDELVENYGDILKKYNLVRRCDGGDYDPDCFIQINNLDELISLNKEVEVSLIFDIKEMTIMIYDNYIE